NLSKGFVTGSKNALPAVAAAGSGGFVRNPARTRSRMRSRPGFSRNVTVLIPFDLIQTSNANEMIVWARARELAVDSRRAWDRERCRPSPGDRGGAGRTSPFCLPAHTAQDAA